MRRPIGKAFVVAALGISLVGLGSAPAMASKLSGARVPAYSSRYEAVPRWYRAAPLPRPRLYLSRRLGLRLLSLFLGLAEGPSLGSSRYLDRLLIRVLPNTRSKIVSTCLV